MTMDEYGQVMVELYQCIYCHPIRTQEKMHVWKIHGQSVENFQLWSNFRGL